MSSGSLRASGPPFILEGCGSRILLAHWVGLHGFGLLSSAFALPGGALLRSACILLVVLSAAVSRPHRPERLVRDSRGRWSAPARHVFGLSLAPQTCYTTWWVHLVLSGPQGQRLRLLLLRDQFPGSAWWALQAGLRTDSWRVPRTPGAALLE